MKKKRLLLSALLAVSIGAMPSVAGDTEVLSDDDLEEVSAQGLQVIRNGNQLFTIANPGHEKGSIQDQDNNLDSVQLRNQAQQNAQIQGVSNVATSSINTNANFLNVGSQVRTSYIEQVNNLTADNHSNEASADLALAGNVNKQKQYVENGYQGSETGTIVSVVRMQNNNNNSVQMRDDAQEYFDGIMAFNAASSSGNAGFNMLTVEDRVRSNSTIVQDNFQTATSFNNNATGGTGAVAVNAEIKDGTNISDIQNWNNPEDTTQVEGSPTQYVKNVYGYNESRPSDISQYTLIDDQNNNNNSVQAKGNVQKHADIDYQANIAKTSANYGQNLISAGNIKRTDIEQYNEQTADNHNNTAVGADSSLAANVNKETQKIENMTYRDHPGPENGKIILQNNNNNSVQYQGEVQKYAQIMVSNNAALSTLNTGFNLTQADSVDISTIDQSNNQASNNFENLASGNTWAYAGNVENTGPTQKVENGYVDITVQNNNNNSVQLSGDVQSEMTSILVSNASKTAANNGLNFLEVSGSIDDSSITQNNIQDAGNHNNTAIALDTDGEARARNVNKETQVIVSDGDFHILPGGEQNNNNNSVQLSGNTQRYAEILVTVNSSLSAVNTGANAIFAADITDTDVEQYNEQTAENMSNFAEATEIGGEAYAQNKEDMAGGYTQKIVNNVANIEGDMRNNNNSVQIIGNSQEELSAFISANSSNSSSNFGVNVLATNEEITTNPENNPALDNADISQGNVQFAKNHGNRAIGNEIAQAQNISKEAQYVKNEEGLIIADGSTQINNNNSVQMSDNAQAGATIALAQNSALSSLNAGLNLMSIGNKIEDSDIEQYNDQTADNFNNYAEADGEALAMNYDGSDNSPFVNHKIENNGGTVAGFQGNINNSVMLSGNAQNSITFISAVNSANSAVNNGINMLAKITDPYDPLGYGNVSSVKNTTITQSNNQIAKNHVNSATSYTDTAYAGNINKQHQEVYNGQGFTLSGRQCNANNSIKLTDNAQANATGLMLVNVANSAVNSGLNIVAISGTNGASISQTNTGGAQNWTNTATGLNAISGNINW